MKKFQILFATLALALLATAQSLQAQTLNNGDGTKQSSPYLYPYNGSTTTMQSFTYTAYSQKAGIDVLNTNASINYEVYIKRTETDQWMLVDRATGVTNVPDAYATNGYDAFIAQPDATQLRVVVYARSGSDFMLTFPQ